MVSIVNIAVKKGTLTLVQLQMFGCTVVRVKLSQLDSFPGKTNVRFRVAICSGDICPGNPPKA